MWCRDPITRRVWWELEQQLQEFKDDWAMRRMRSETDGFDQRALKNERALGQTENLMAIIGMMDQDFLPNFVEQPKDEK
jgi:hypothetical protein